MEQGAFSQIPARDRDAIFLAACVFWIESYIRNSMLVGILPEVSEFGKITPNNISGFLATHPSRKTLFGSLTDQEIREICLRLKEVFDNQEFCAQCEGWSYYNAPSMEEFAFSTASLMLALCGVDGRPIIPWFEEIFNGRVRGWVVETVCRRKAEELGGMTKLLSGPGPAQLEIPN